MRLRPGRAPPALPISIRSHRTRLSWGELDVFEQHAERLAAAAATEPAKAEPAAAAWQGMALAARSGDPAGFGQAMTAATGAMDALVDEVVEHYRVGLT